MKLKLIYARAANGVIGFNNQMPWHLPEDLAHFKRTTLGCPVLMGRKTWESIPMQFRPLPQRRNIVISRQRDLPLPDGVVHAESLEKALDFLAKEESRVGKIFVIGGAQIFSEALKHPACQKLYVTRIDDEFLSCNYWFPK